jgi:hypothetical protein
MGDPAWKSLLFAKRMGATVVEVPSSHLAMVSHSGDVATLAEAAVESVSR